MGNPKLIPYETIVRATSGEPEAVEEVLRHYSKRIRVRSRLDLKKPIFRQNTLVYMRSTDIIMLKIL